VDLTGQLGVMIWFCNSISNKIIYYKFWSGRTIEIRPKHVHRGHLTILGVYVPTKGREDLSGEFYATTEENG